MSRQKQSKADSSWVVVMTCTVRKEVVCDGCTEDEARSDPWSHARSESDIEKIDWKVDSVHENK